MKHLWILAFCGSLCGQALPTGGDCTVLTKQYYTICYSVTNKLPVWTQNSIEKPNRDATARTNDFRPDPELRADQQASLADYRRSGFDRGHLAPSGDFAALGPRAVSESFLLTNMAPEWPNLNRKLWRDLEIAVRKAAARTRVYVVTGTVLINRKSIGAGVRVPDFIFKAAYVNGKTYGYVLPNVRNPQGAFEDYAVSVDRIETLTGLNLFPDIAEELEREVNRLP